VVKSGISLNSMDIRIEMQTENDGLKNPYCENCFQEDLTEYYVDSLGSVFCSVKCFLESQEWRTLNVNDLELEKIE